MNHPLLLIDKTYTQDTSRIIQFPGTRPTGEMVRLPLAADARGAGAATTGERRSRWLRGVHP